MKVLFIGYGRMGGALGDAWKSKHLVSRIDAVDPSFARSLSEGRYAIASELPSVEYDLVILALKPAMAGVALAGLSAVNLSSATILSIMAGVTIDKLRASSGTLRPIVRAMPNTPVMVGAGCTGLYARDHLSEQQRSDISALFTAVGTAHWVGTEDHLHAVTAISGSGPAYYHLFSEALAQAGESLGLSPQLARDLAAQTALGAARQQAGGGDFLALREAVTSPNGTTFAAIQVFEGNHSLRALVKTAAAAANERSKQLSDE
jgi:pyrroline-5-carboxylate reductase